MKHEVMYIPFNPKDEAVALDRRCQLDLFMQKHPSWERKDDITLIAYPDGPDSEGILLQAFVITRMSPPVAGY